MNAFSLLDRLLTGCDDDNDCNEDEDLNT